MARFDYVTVGHVTADVLADLGPDVGDPEGEGVRQPGGGAFYSALQAARFGLHTLILTQGVAREIEELLEPYRTELSVRIAPAAQTTTLLTRDGPRGRRQQVLAWAGPIAPPSDVDAAILHLAPVARETPSSWQGRAEFVGLTPQGLVRRWGEDGEIARTPLARELAPERIDAVVCSAGELASCEQLLPGAAGHGATEPGTAGPVVAVTAGARPLTLHLPGDASERVSVQRVADPHDELGAGDVFAAAFFIGLREGLAPAIAGELASAAAAVRIEGASPDAIGDRHVATARFRQTRAQRR